MTTEYEQLLSRMLEEKRAKLAELTGKKGTDKDSASVASDIKFLEVELQRYQQGMALFRTKDVPRVGRWGMPEAEDHREEAQRA